MQFWKSYVDLPIVQYVMNELDINHETNVHFLESTPSAFKCKITLIFLEVKNIIKSLNYNVSHM